MSGTEVSNDVVKDSILSNISSMKVPYMRPNKLRKILCKETNCTWTQYQNILDGLIGDGTVKTNKIEGDLVILSSSSATGKKSEPQSAAKTPPNTTSETISEEMIIPIEVIFHLTRKGHKKQKNIETNTKTKITYDSQTTRITKSKQADGVKNGTLIITKSWNPLQADPDVDEKEAKKEAKKIAKKQFKAAKFFIQGMVKSFKENPEHFAPKKAGGTFAEQDEAKKIKQEMSKRRKNNRGDMESGEKKKKKKPRKFY